MTSDQRWLTLPGTPSARALSFTFMFEAILASDVMLSSNLGGEWRLSTHPDSIDSTQSPRAHHKGDHKPERFDLVLAEGIVSCSRRRMLCCCLLKSLRANIDPSRASQRTNG